MRPKNCSECDPVHTSGAREPIKMGHWRNVGCFGTGQGARRPAHARHAGVDQMYRSHFAAGFAVMTAAVVDATCAHATLRVGGAVVVERNVSGAMQGERPTKMYKGSDVYESQIIRSEAESSAQLRFTDSTLIPIGPATSLKIDRFVVNPD